MVNTIIQRGGLKRVTEMMADLQMFRPLIIGGEKRIEVLKAQLTTLMDTPSFFGFQSNPNWEDCENAVKLFINEGCDGLISIGGGSAMDTAKAIKAQLLAGSPESALKLKFKEQNIPHIAIPGTAGTGSEATQFAVVYIEQKKYSLSHERLLPDGVILDADLLSTMPEYHRKSCLLDALCQGIESWWAKGGNDDSRQIAIQCIREGFGNLRAYMKHDQHAEDQILLSAYHSGQAINTSRTTAAHAMSYAVTKTLGLAHGHACALTLPYLWKHALHDEEMTRMLQTLSDQIGLQSADIFPEIWIGLLAELDML